MGGGQSIYLSRYGKDSEDWVAGEANHS